MTEEKLLFRNRLVVLAKRRYYLNTKHWPLIEFLRRYSEHRNLKNVIEDYPEAIITWQDRDEYLISTDRPIDDNRYRPAATTRLEQLGYDFVYKYEYYLHSGEKRFVTETEALAQALLIYMGDPRIKREITKGLHSGKILERDLRDYCIKYGILHLFEGMVT